MNLIKRGYGDVADDNHYGGEILIPVYQYIDSCVKEMLFNKPSYELKQHVIRIPEDHKYVL